MILMKDENTEIILFEKILFFLRNWESHLGLAIYLDLQTRTTTSSCNVALIWKKTIGQYFDILLKKN